MFFLLGGAVILGMATIVWWALKRQRTPDLFFGLSIARAERPILYWAQIVCYAAVMALIACVVGTIALANISN